MAFGKKILSLFSLFAASAFADTPADSSDFQRYSAVPVIGYTEETQFQCGAMILLFLKPDEAGRKIPEIGFTAYGSSRGQLQIVLEPYLYLYHDKIGLWFDLAYQDWIASYFGLGNSPDIDEFTKFNRKKLYLGAKLESRVGMPEGFKYGVEFHIENSEIDFDKNSSIPLPDPHSGRRNGLGYLLAFDTKDNSNWTRHGVLVEWKQMFFPKTFSDYGFHTETFDIRGYASLSDKTTIATAALWKQAKGDVPFDMLAGPDGISRFRGTESLYFNDKQSLILQSEIRQFFGWRLGAHAFFEGGKAGDHFSELMRNRWHRSVGFGGLFALNLKERLFARADVSWVDFDHIGLSFYVREAF